MTALDTRLRDDAEAWARESSGVQFVSGINWMGSCSPDWTDHDGSGLVVRVEPEPESPVGLLFMPERVRFTVDHLVAWLVRHAVDTGREVRRRCPDCDAGTQRHTIAFDSDIDQDHAVAWCIGHEWHSVTNWKRRTVEAHRPCPTCSTKATYHDTHGKVRNVHEPLGYLDTPLARVVCEGAPRECGWCRNGWIAFDDQPCADCVEGLISGDPTARTELLVMADEYQDKGEPWATGLALWLSGAPCEACKGERAVYWDGEDCHPPGMVDCGDCGGHGTALAAYVAQQLALVGEMRPAPAGDSPVDRMDATVAL